MNERRFKLFTDDELYTLRRQAGHSSFYMVMSEKYDEEIMKLHVQLINEILKEICIRKKESYGQGVYYKV